MSALNATQRANLDAARQAVLTISSDMPPELHGEAMEVLLMEIMATHYPHPLKCAEDAAFIALAAMALARLVEHERGERELAS